MAIPTTFSRTFGRCCLQGSLGSACMAWIFHAAVKCLSPRLDERSRCGSEPHLCQTLPSCALSGAATLGPRSRMACAFLHVHDPINPAGAATHRLLCPVLPTKTNLLRPRHDVGLAREFAPKYAEPVNLAGAYRIQPRSPSKTPVIISRRPSHSNRDNFAEAHNNLGAIFHGRAQLHGEACDAFKPGHRD